ncbi:MICOS complex subunit MIC27 [Venturia canescens]|uniref:MICOS complex subunit MIC27 n=1 Tax=Venturia canescens TaxID=32260 RepID=UPI001C9C800F|nr:MICOS complex subunit MIC27 [Venturia canescens]
MQGVKLFKKFLMPCGLCAAVPVLKPASPDKNFPSNVTNETQEPVLIRPSELPIYVAEESCVKAKPCENQVSAPFIENGFGTIRKGVQGLFSEYSAVTEGFNNKISTGYEHSLLMLDYLREESNMMPRLGAVGIGGLAGLIFSLRGGKFKRFIYTSTGALSVAAVCYPKQAQESFSLVKHYANIGYNFVYGVKPGDANQLEIKWPEMPKVELPKSTSDFAELASSFTSAVGSLLSKATDALTDNTEKKEPSTESKPKAD